MQAPNTRIDRFLFSIFAMLQNIFIPSQTFQSQFMLNSMLHHITGTLLLATLTLGVSTISTPSDAMDGWHLSSLENVTVYQIEPARAETLSYVSQAGEVLIFNLPATLGQRKIDSYTITKAPALSWLVKKSFFWRTLPKDAGKHEILLKAVADGRNVEDVVVQVEIR